MTQNIQTGMSNFAHSFALVFQQLADQASFNQLSVQSSNKNTYFRATIPDSLVQVRPACKNFSAISRYRHNIGCNSQASDQTAPDTATLDLCQQKTISYCNNNNYFTAL